MSFLSASLPATIIKLSIFCYANKLLTVHVSAVPYATEQPAVGKPTLLLSINVPDAFPGAHATSSCGVYGSAAISCSAANDLPAADAGKQKVALSLCAYARAFLRDCIPLFKVRSVVSLVGRTSAFRRQWAIFELPLASVSNESSCETIHIRTKNARKASRPHYRFRSVSLSTLNA